MNSDRNKCKITNWGRKTLNIFFEMGFPISLIFIILLLISPIWAIDFNALLKKGNKVINIIHDGNISTIEELPLKGNIPIFSTFKVELKGRKVLLKWKSANSSVTKILIITDLGDLKIFSSKNVKLYISKNVNLIRIFPVGKKGKLGLPVEIYIRNKDTLGKV